MKEGGLRALRLYNRLTPTGRGATVYTRAALTPRTGLATSLNFDLNELAGRVNLISSTSPAPAPGAAPTSVSSLPQSPNPSTVAALHADTKSTGRSFQVMAQSAIDKIPPGPKLDTFP